MLATGQVGIRLAGFACCVSRLLGVLVDEGDQPWQRYCAARILDREVDLPLSAACLAL
jgi:hypothetical protein